MKALPARGARARASLELYDAAGEQVAQFFGKRKPGHAESEDWRALLASAVSVPSGS